MFSKNILHILGIGFELSFSFAVPLLIFTLAGFWLDGKLPIAPWGSIAGVIIGMYISFLIVYQLLKPLLDDNKN